MKPRLLAEDLEGPHVNFGLVPNHSELLALCESPIEQQFLLALERHPRRLRDARAECRANEIGRFAIGCGLRILALVQEPQGNYRTDFAFRLDEPGLELAFDVELDGLDYHSDAQAFLHDRIRDRQLVAAGWTVLRFAGTEVVRNASGCVDELFDILDQHVARRLP